MHRCVKLAFDSEVDLEADGDSEFELITKPSSRLVGTCNYNHY